VALQLHYYPSNASLAPHILLEELGRPFELVLVDRTREAHKSPAYLALNPNGQIPVLVDGDLVLYEAAAICLHLVDTHPAAGIAPALGTRERAHFYKWLVWMTNTLQPMLMTYYYPERAAESAAAVAEVKVRAEQRAGPLLDQLDAELERHRGPWLLGDRFSAADPYALMLGRWTRGFARPARSLPQLGPYLARVLARPAARRVFEREELPEPWV
jgi:glutathione S-transferase